MKKYDVTALGELLIDFTYTGTSDQGNSLLEANPGGAPCNVLAMLNQCGRTTNFIGKVGKDQFGDLLRDTLANLKIGMDGLRFDEEVNTTLAFVKTFENGDRDFAFYRNPGADMMLTETQVEEEQVKNSHIFHFGTLSMTAEGVCRATEKAVNAAKEAGVLISFDPNLRIPLWKDLQTAKEKMEYGLSKADVCKISEEEVEFLTGEKEIEKGAQILRDRFPVKLLLVTAGAKGSYAFYKDMIVYQPSFKLGGTIETTGAGDTFCGSILHNLLERNIDELTEDDLKQMLIFANAAAYLVTTKKGAIRSMPTIDEVWKMIEENT
ncbi:MAG: carbohydrate kinase [Lachnospiraceae bacterium]|nr:carbohydrate kinase [Lachnospiraceae bacterium]